MRVPRSPPSPPTYDTRTQIPAPLAAFYCKVRGNVLPTREMVSRGRGDAANPACPSCHDRPETLDHLFFECTDRTLALERLNLSRRLRQHNLHAALNIETLLAAVHPRGPSLHDELPWSRHLLRQPPIQEDIVSLTWQIWKARAVALGPAAPPNVDNPDEPLSQAIMQLTLDPVRQNNAPTFERLVGRRHRVNSGGNNPTADTVNSNRNNNPASNIDSNRNNNPVGNINSNRTNHPASNTNYQGTTFLQVILTLAGGTPPVASPTGLAEHAQLM
eukprot:CAMPEP_0177651396 /NCGR_PEP_ID=MMETSP0447-20121125/12524_1 /TAXON_ID=0 /ORGANISM="Stygamoeba regulata, Strain BSH-02190019" /LENGTH=273 /DNA_ID=CAMNT_0019154471 /DNA_START=63 /DNA_END=885 /DNA_ORIENTATION=+